MVLVTVNLQFNLCLRTSLLCILKGVHCRLHSCALGLPGVSGQAIFRMHCTNARRSLHPRPSDAIHELFNLFNLSTLPILICTILHLRQVRGNHCSRVPAAGAANFGRDSCCPAIEMAMCERREAASVRLCELYAHDPRVYM